MEQNTTSSFQAIMQATEALIQEKGCRQTTLQDILKKTGLSKGAIYHYVTGKDELLGLVLKARVEQMNERFMALVNDPGTIGLDNPLQLIAAAFVQTSQPEDATNKIFIYLLSQMDNPTVAGIMQDVYQYTSGVCAKWIEVGQQSGVIPPDRGSSADREPHPDPYVRHARAQSGAAGVRGRTDRRSDGVHEAGSAILIGKGIRSPCPNDAKSS
ncbi:TetR/AcrR family transcriptional regulator [Cohnella ginsengisoli]|uniref:TetR/AcrR family transcriptional regulator n=1 Tax=Cohnella ginsengisoli TaxID=425004 RepID=A0A9X4KM82_9BACL|nr:TetR/AcrR family transcriptional regulator [Cohnella ginsengisoli]MDG0793989.1 TetR/AcrR family transcriptional regulator [Cohnella ginsengisoli]